MECPSWVLVISCSGDGIVDDGGALQEAPLPFLAGLEFPYRDFLLSDSFT
jgi:hypothetical protein